MRGCIFDIQRFSTHDGPGVRTTVFFKGCPLRCAWCHNPEGISPRPELSFTSDKCLGCGECAQVCPNHAHALMIEAGGVVHTLNRSRCQVCGRCAAACDQGCLELVGREVTVDEVMQAVLADRAFYRHTGGGLTVSGGEPLLQIDFAAAVLEAAKAEGLHCTVETCGFVSWNRLRRILPAVDLFLYDYKATGAAEHERWTGQSNEMILRNLRGLHDEGARIRLQCPIIPGCNDTPDHHAGIAALAAALPRLEGVHLLPYHPLGRSKVDGFGRPVPFAIDPGPAGRTVENWAASLRRIGIRVFDSSTQECS
ncbi:MAG: glycyl-radical enzyme activating protein [Acidobacteria bacterium]|nr:glycyl-radical enzyme activating protein [Acidobacteriota bacterium]